jgi:hypothetical protein
LQEELEQKKHLEVLNSKRLTRNSTGGFDSRTMCILCGQDVDMSEKCKPKRRKVETHTIVQKWCEVCEKRNDQWGQEVAARLEFFNKDLVAADAIYHTTCAIRFKSCLTKQPGVSKVGRPIKEIASDAFNIVCRHLEASCESGLYTVKELHEMMVNYTCL